MSSSLTGDRWRRFEPLLDAALALAPESRPSFLARVCANDADLRAELERMLAECERPDARLDRPAVERFPAFAIAEVSSSLAIPTTLAGRYRLERELGSGGAAVVYRARDLQYDRDVAVKVLRAASDSLVRPERFHAEIRVTAKLRHPNILPLFDSGDAEGRLWYVMPLVEGETLRERLARVGVLPAADVVRIASQVASALDYAHAQGVVHRDIKPANILLVPGGDHVYVADFGIALALSHVGDRRFTSEGLAVGTPEYMSPEQRRGDAVVDGRSDVYSLGCVVAEMLTGVPRGPATAVGRAFGLVRSQQVSRSALPRSMSPPFVSCLARATSIDPAMRFATAEAMVGTLRQAMQSEYRRHRISRTWLGGAAVGVVLAATLGREAFRAVDERASASDPALSARDAPRIDTTRYVVFPFDYDDRVRERLREEELLRDALLRWAGVVVVDRYAVRDALGARGGNPLHALDARRLALGLGAGRYVRGSVSPSHGELRVHAALYATRTNDVLVERTLITSPVSAGDEGIFTALAESLLFRDERGESRSLGAGGTRSAPARQAFAQGQRAIAQWDLARADEEFSAATSFDPLFAQAYLWLAQVRFWNGRVPATWRFAAEKAAKDRQGLSVRDQLISDALLAEANGDPVSACGDWARVTRMEPRSFEAWYGYGTCLSRDNAVLHDRASPSGWRFRSSYHSAIQAYARAFQILPTERAAFNPRWLSELQLLLRTDANLVRFGWATPPDTTAFMAHPSWRNDSLVFVPYRRSDFAAGRAGTWPTSIGSAIRHHRELFKEIATTWVTAFPQSAGAMATLALALELLDDPSAIDSLRRARALSSDREEQLRLAGTEVWLLVKRSLPDHQPGLRLARALADSLLSAARDRNVRAPAMLASLAALTGRAALLASLVRLPEALQRANVPGFLAASAPPLLAFSAMGGPLDSITVFESRVDQSIREVSDATLRDTVRGPWLFRPATLAFPAYHFRALGRVGNTGDYVADLQAALMRGDTGFVRRGLARLRRDRRNMSAFHLTPDGFYPEAALLESIGEVATAATWLSAALNASASIESRLLADPTRAGALVRAMALRADIADRLHDDAAAKTWAGAVVTLWSNADPFLQPLVTRMRRMSLPSSKSR